MPRLETKDARRRAWTEGVVGRERPIPAVVDGGGGARERGFYHQDGGGDVLSGGKKKLAVVVVPSNRNLSTGNSLLLLPLSPLSL